MPGFCRDCRCDVAEAGTRCPACGSPKVLRHPELDRLAVAHVDCDAFYATIEKRDDPSLADKPVIVGGRQRGVVLTCCYVARTFGVRSAMPMFEARRLCPSATVVRPDMEKYARIGAQVRLFMLDLTPLVEPVSIDEAFMDLSGTERLHGTSPAKALAGFADRVEREIGITVSIGLSCNKFLAKIASDLDKPRGTVGDLQRASEADLARRYGAEGTRLARLSRGIDDRPVRAERETKSISAETTFDQDIAEFRALELRLWRLCEKVSARLKGSELAGATVTLKLKAADFRLRTRAQSFGQPTQLAAKIFACGRELLARETDGTRYRLIGIGVSALMPAAPGDFADLIDRRSADVELAMDRLRARFGDEAVVKGLVFDQKDEE
jgi:DNA polymerase-4